jgi:hypothetical protein
VPDRETVTAPAPPAAGRRIASYGLQALCYAAFMSVVGFCSSSPPYTPLTEGQAVVKLSLRHAGLRRQACRDRSAEELAKLAPNMRASSVCPRERSAVAVEVRMDGEPLFSVVAPPSGLSKDGASTVYRRVSVTAGVHRFSAALSDTADGAVRFRAERSVELVAGRVLVIDFDDKQGGWIFRG